MESIQLSLLPYIDLPPRVEGAAAAANDFEQDPKDDDQVVPDISSFP